MWTAEFAAFHDAFVALAHAAESWVPPSAVPDEWRAAYYAQQHPEARAGAIRRANERQAVLLKSILPQPFAEAAVLGRAS